MDNGNLPVAHLESLKFKCHQFIESIQTLQQLLEYGGQSHMPSWPDILSKCNVLVSQSVNFSNALGKKGENIALHPATAMSDAQLDNDVIPLLRNQQTNEVLRVENACVRKLAGNMRTGGSLGLMKGRTDGVEEEGGGKMVRYEDVLRECEEIRAAHDQRVERAVRAVLMLKDKSEWKARVEVEAEELEGDGVGSDVEMGAMDVDDDNFSEDESS